MTTRLLPFLLTTLLFPAAACAETAAKAVGAADIESCVAYFTSGGLEQWIGGGALVAISLAGAFTRWNIPSGIKAVARWVVDRNQKDPQV